MTGWMTVAAMVFALTVLVIARDQVSQSLSGFLVEVAPPPAAADTDGSGRTSGTVGIAVDGLHIAPYVAAQRTHRAWDVALDRVGARDGSGTQ